MGRIREVTNDFVLLDSLKALAARLADDIDACDDVKLLPPLARQYRETMIKIDAIEGGNTEDDEIAAIIIRNRQSDTD